VVLHDPAGQKTVLHPFCANPACIQLAGRDIGRLKDMLILELSTDYINRRITTNPALVQQLKNNRERIRHDLDVGVLFQSAPGSAACVAAAGPTLSEHYHRLKKRESKGPLIAVDAALKPLLDNDIIPDIVVSIDPRRNTIMACFDVDLARLRAASLVYFPVVHPDILDQWQGRRYVAYSTSPIYDEIKSELSRRALFSSGSVIHPAVDLAVRMGCKRIELCGADFGFPDGEIYVKGSPVGKAYKDSNKSVVWVTNGRGEEIKSTRQFRGYQLDFEKYIEAHPEVEFVNGSDKGAHIMGTSLMLKEC
jgi:hypothetical protein